MHICILTQGIGKRGGRRRERDLRVEGKFEPQRIFRQSFQILGGAPLQLHHSYLIHKILQATLAEELVYTACQSKKYVHLATCQFEANQAQECLYARPVLFKVWPPYHQATTSHKEARRCNTLADSSIKIQGVQGDRPQRSTSASACCNCCRSSCIRSLLSTKKQKFKAKKDYQGSNSNCPYSGTSVKWSDASGRFAATRLRSPSVAVTHAQMEERRQLVGTLNSGTPS